MCQTPPNPQRLAPTTADPPLAAGGMTGGGAGAGHGRGVDTGRRRRDAEEVVGGTPSRAWAVLGLPSAGRVLAGVFGHVVRGGRARAVQAKGPPQLWF